MKLEYRRHFAEEERAPVEFKLVSVVIDELNAVVGVESGQKLLIFMSFLSFLLSLQFNRTFRIVIAVPNKSGAFAL